MAFIDRIKDSVVEFLRPGTRQESGELSALREMYDPANSAGGMVPNRWYRLHSESGACVGFSFVCNCGKEYQLLSAFEWLRHYSCPMCKAKFDLYKYAGITDGDGNIRVKPLEIEALLAKLPVRPRLAGRSAGPRFLDTWESCAGDVVYDGTANTGFGVGRA